jgi:type VI secretion system protein ImpE
LGADALRSARNDRNLVLAKHDQSFQPSGLEPSRNDAGADGARICAASLEAEALLIAHTYRGLIHAEQARAAVFAGQCSPAVLVGSKPWIAQLATCLSLQRQGRTACAAQLRIDAFEVAPQVTGFINGCAFASIADADSRLGPLLEIIVGGSYYWAPFACIQRIVMERVTNTRNLAWLPAQFTWRTGERSTGFIPARYPGSEHCDDDAIRLAQKTRWQPIGENCFVGLGQRLLRTNTDEIGILDVRDISLAEADIHGCFTHISHQAAMSRRGISGALR